MGWSHRRRRHFVDIGALAIVAVIGVSMWFYGTNEHVRLLGASLIGWVAGYTWKERDIKRSLAPVFAGVAAEMTATSRTAQALMSQLRYYGDRLREVAGDEQSARIIAARLLSMADWIDEHGLPDDEAVALLEQAHAEGALK